MPASAIRHWEKMGLIDMARAQANGYRTFTPPQIRLRYLHRLIELAER